MEEVIEGAAYKNLISRVDIDRNVDSIEYFKFDKMVSEIRFREFLNDISSNNDVIELNLIKNNAYKEAVIISLNTHNGSDKYRLLEMIKVEQKTFGGSKLFYLNDSCNKILVMAVSKSIEGKFSMVINRFNKINDKVNRLNLRIKRENLDTYMNRKGTNEKKDALINIINRNLRV